MDYIYLNFAVGEMAGGKKILNNHEEYTRCFIPMLDTVRNPLNPNRPSRSTSDPSRYPPSDPTGHPPETPKSRQKGCLSGTQLDLDELHDIISVKRKMIVDLDDDAPEPKPSKRS